jgi:hypothetical protein
MRRRIDVIDHRAVLSSAASTAPAPSVGSHIAVYYADFGDVTRVVEAGLYGLPASMQYYRLQMVQNAVP